MKLSHSQCQTTITQQFVPLSRLCVVCSCSACFSGPFLTVRSQTDCLAASLESIYQGKVAAVWETLLYCFAMFRVKCLFVCLPTTPISAQHSLHRSSNSDLLFELVTQVLHYVGAFVCSRWKIFVFVQQVTSSSGSLSIHFAISVGLSCLPYDLVEGYPLQVYQL